MTNFIIKMWKTRAKLCAKFWVNFVYIFVDFLSFASQPHFYTPLFPLFHHSLHPLLNTSLISVIIKTFPLFHRPYYYYDLLNNNYI